MSLHPVAAVAAAVLLLAGCAGPPREPGQDGGRRGGPPGGRSGLPEPGAAPFGSAAEFRTSVAEQQYALLDSTRRQLKLTPAQMPLWQRYAEQVEALLGDLSRPTPPAAEPVDALVAIGHRVDRVRNRLAALEAIEAAARSLLAELTPEQRSLADRLLPRTVPNLYGDLFAIGAPPGGPGPDGRGMRGGPPGGGAPPGGGTGPMRRPPPN